jgi:hypothetical protein
MIWSPEAESELVQGSPLLQQLLSQVASFIPDVHLTKSALKLPGHRSGCPAFLHGVGTPCLSLLFSNQPVRNIQYLHNYLIFNKDALCLLILNNFQTLLSSVKIASISAWLLSDTSLLQYDLTALLKAVTNSIANLNSIYDSMLKEHNLSLSKYLYM